MAEAWFVYLVRCADESYYCGVTTDLERRVEAHSAGKGARYTRGRGPVELLASAGPMEQGDALRLELLVKRAPREKKLEVLAAT